MIADLFAQPPITDTEIPERLRHVDHELARQLLITRLRSSEPTDSETELFMALFGYLGVGGQRSEMAEIVIDDQQSHRVRAYACGLLATEDPVLAERLMDSLPLEDRIAIIDVPFVDMLVWAQADPRAGDQLAVALDGLDEDAQVITFERLEIHRKRVGTGAVSAYGPALRRGRASGLHRLMIDALVEESAPEGLELVQSMRDAEREPASRRRWQAALLRMGTRAIDPDAQKDAPEGRAYVSSCDHLGDFILLGCIDNPDGSVSAANVCIRSGGEIRGGFVLLRQTPNDVDEILGDLERSGGGFAPVPLSEAAGMVEEAARRTTARRKRVPRDAEPAMALLRRAAWHQPEAEIEVVPAWDTSLERVHALLNRPEHARIWILTAADLEVLHVLPPPSKGMDEAWIREAAAWWARRSKRRTRLVAMARHMALWHRARKEHEEAALCATLARMTEKRLSTSPLVLAMLERAFLRAKDDRTAFSDPDLRDAMRRTLFGDVRVPKGKDLARLDFAEAAFATLGDAVAEIDPAPLPSDLRMHLAGAIGEAFVSGRIGKKNPTDLERLARKVSRIVRDTLPMSPITANDVTGYVLSTLDAFQHDVCANCPVRCIERTRAHFETDFFANTHPALDTDDVPF